MRFWQSNRVESIDTLSKLAHEIIGTGELELMRTKGHGPGIGGRIILTG